MSSPTPDTSDRLIDVGLVSLAAMRIGIGGLAWVKPDLTARLFGFSRPDAQSRYLWRLFGARDVVIGLGTVSSSGPRRRVWAGVGVACDVADGGAGALGRRDVTPVSAAAMIGVPAAAVAFGGWALRRKR